MRESLLEDDPIPEPIVVDLVDSLTHISNRFTGVGSPEDNILLARNKLVSATFLCYEIITVAIATEISSVCDDPEVAKYGIDGDYCAFQNKHVEFINLSKKAVRLEKEKLDESCIKAIGTYDEAIKLGRELLDKINWTKIEDFRRDKSNYDQIIEALGSNKNHITIAAIVLIIITAIINYAVPGAIGHLINLTRLR